MDLYYGKLLEILTPDSKKDKLRHLWATLTLSLEEWVYIIYQDVDGDNLYSNNIYFRSNSKVTSDAYN